MRSISRIAREPPKMGNYPDATAVFDVDAIGLVNIVHNLNLGLDLGGNPIGTGTGFVIGVGANPGLTDLDEEVRRFELRVAVPDSILERMARAQTPEAARGEGVAIAREMLIAARQMAQGAQISAPQGRYSSAVDVLEALGGDQGSTATA